MPSIIPGYEYDIFISYRQNDNQDGWVTEFVENLNREIKSTFKEQISIYFDENPYDGLGETHDVDDSLAKKLKCLIFIPVISRTYCDPNSFAWTNEFLVFKRQAENDEYGLKVDLPNGNTASRILPIRIHDIDDEDKQLVESEIGFLRAIDFVYQEPGVNRPLKQNDDTQSNLNKTSYPNQVNKVANSIHEIIKGVKGETKTTTQGDARFDDQERIQPDKVKADKKGILWGILAILLVAAVSYFLMTRPSDGDLEEIDKSIAVIPFDNLSNDDEQQYFADGVMEDILTQLQRMGDLRVTSRTSVEQYRDSKKSAPVIGEELKVSYLLEGSVRKSGNQIMITVQLIRASDDSHIWADNFPSEYTMEGLFDIQRKIAENIVSQLRVKILPEQVEEITKIKTVNKDAYEHFSKGKKMYWLFNQSGNEAAIQQFRLAIQNDSSYSDAYGELSNAYLQGVIYYGYDGDWIDSAKSLANQGIILDENCAGCYKALGLIHSMTGTNKVSIDYYEKALLINPNYETAANNVTNNYAEIGDFRSAFSKIHAAARLVGNNYRTLLGKFFVRSLGDPHKAIQYLEKEIKYATEAQTLNHLLHAYALNNNDEKVREMSEVLFNLSGDSTDLHNANMLLLWNNKEYQKVIDYFENEMKGQANYGIWTQVLHGYFSIGEYDKSNELSKKGISDILSPYNNNPQLVDSNIFLAGLAFCNAMLGQKEKALDFLERAVEMNYLIDISTDLHFQTLFEEPRFQELIKKQETKRKEVMDLYATFNFPEPEES